MMKIVACACAVAAIALTSARAEDSSPVAATGMRTAPRAAAFEAAAEQALEQRGYSKVREIYCDDREWIGTGVRDGTVRFLKVDAGGQVTEQ